MCKFFQYLGNLLFEKNIFKYILETRYKEQLINVTTVHGKKKFIYMSRFMHDACLEMFKYGKHIVVTSKTNNTVLCTFDR